MRQRPGERIETRHLWFLEASVSTRLEVSEIAEDTLFELFHVSDGATESLKAEDECSDDICAGDVIKTAPEDTGDVFLIWQKEPIERRVCRTRVTYGDRRGI